MNNATNTMTDPDCEFLVTKAIILPNSQYEICVQANDQVSSQTWSLFGWDGIWEQIAFGDQPTMCWTVSADNSFFAVNHYVEHEAGFDTCYFYFSILPDTLCKDEILVVTFDSCDLEASIQIELDNINVPYVITFGDDSPAQQSSAGTISHTYAQPGNYEICLSYIDPITSFENLFITCCYPVEIHCECPEDVITLVEVEPCTWIADLYFNLPIDQFPLSVDYGDGNSAVITERRAQNDYAGPGNYLVCYTYRPPEFPGDSLTCCEWITIPDCCLDAYFELSELNDSPSCLNPMYEISHVTCQANTIETTHTWLFSDGRVHYGAYPPDDLFTNFITEDSVCVTHIIVCCDSTVSHRVCLPHRPGVYLGTPGTALRLTDTLPFNNQSVFDFIYENANGPLPLTIDGTLVVDMDAAFLAGTWNMGKDAEILIPGKFDTLYPGLFLAGTTIQSAARLNLSSCCRWNGIHSEGLTNIILNQASIKDAKYAIHYPALEGVAGSPYPVLSSTSSNFINNFYGIKSVRQFVYFPRFYGNTMVGASHEDPEICGCEAVNAIDFRYVNLPVNVSIGSSSHAYNVIKNFEQGFHFENTNLFVRGFRIYDLQDYAEIGDLTHNNPEFTGASIGIDYHWFNRTNSTLDIDYIRFSDFNTDDAWPVAVREYIYGGRHTLRAIASQPLSSITTSELAGGYEIFCSSAARIEGRIEGNYIHTNGGNQFGFGIAGDFLSSKNSLIVKNNEFDISSNPANPFFLGGIMLNSGTSTALDQEFRITDNTIDVALDFGAGIGITNAFGSVVRRNTLVSSVKVPGIHLRNGGRSIIDCNNVQQSTIGINVEHAAQNSYSKNYLRSNTRDMEFTGNAMGDRGSLIRWNTFWNSNFESLLYHTDAITGPQHHNQFNQWRGQDGVEAVHEGWLAEFCQFWHPFGEDPPSIMYPHRVPTELFVPGQMGAPIDTVPPNLFCTVEYDYETPPQDSLASSKSAWIAIVKDTAYWEALSAAEQTYMQQDIYGLLLSNPDWPTLSADLLDFKDGNDSSFVGKSENLKHRWKLLMQDISDHQASFLPERIGIDSLSDIAQDWLQAMHADTSLLDSLLILYNAALLQADSLGMLVHEADSVFFLSVQDSVTVLLSLNAALDDNEWHTWCEKRYNEIALNWLSGSEPDSSDNEDLRLIAQSCLHEGGRAVLSARGLCEVWLKEHYKEEDCQSIAEKPRAIPTGVKEEKTSTLLILPNPAGDMVQIRLENSTHGEQRVEIFALSGRQMFSDLLSPQGVLSVSVKTWPNGMYIVKANNGATRRFVVQHP